MDRLLASFIILALTICPRISAFGMAQVLLFTGRPGIGKTTVIHKISRLLQASETSFRGFITLEIREGSERKGFKLIDFDGRESVISHVNFPMTYKVGKYGVDIGAIDAACSDLIVKDSETKRPVFLIDEIGKMECLSSRFVAAMRGLLTQPDSLVIATVALQGSGFIEEVKHMPRVTIWEVSTANRDALPEQASRWLRCAAAAAAAPVAPPPHPSGRPLSAGGGGSR